MKRFITVRFTKVFFYSCGFILFYLAGMYFGGYYRTMFLIYALLPAASIVLLLSTWRSVKFHQDFSTNHPLKGQDVTYTITLSKESFLPSSHILVTFRTNLQGLLSEETDIKEIPSSKKPYISEKIIKCPFRGVYTVGLESLIIEDLLRFVSLSVPVWFRTFYVYPRIIELKSVQLGIQGQRINLSGSVEGSVQDYTLLESLKNYRAGESIRHISWKKFGSVGQPFIKTFDTSAQPGITIYLDTRRMGTADFLGLSSEDCSVEILVSVVKVLVRRKIPVAVHAAGWENYQFLGEDEAYFSRFHHNTVNIYFKPGPSPVELFRADVADNRLSTQSVLFITHILDPEILNLVGVAAEQELSTAAVFNISGFVKEEKEKALVLLNTARENNSKIFIVHDTDSIKEDLE